MHTSAIEHHHRNQDRRDMGSGLQEAVFQRLLGTLEASPVLRQLRRRGDVAQENQVRSDVLVSFRATRDSSGVST